jgi:purine-nucleoside phosphorylase
MKKLLPGSKAVSAIKKSLGIKSADLAIVLGSGWSDLIKELNTTKSVSYARIPGMGKTSVKGHAGKLHLLKQGGNNILIFQGRRHFYEGSGWDPVLMPVYISARLGVHTMMLTNAAGGINPKLKPGSLMLITDHINMMGTNPLIGPHISELGPRFPDQAAIYDRKLGALLRSCARKEKAALTAGVYMAVTGPTYETPAEINAFKRLGADAIGMSTAPEASVASAAGIRVCAISCIANSASGSTAVTHKEVLDNTKNVMPTMTRIIRQFCKATAR